MTNTTNSAPTLKNHNVALFSGSHADPPAPEKI